VDWKKPFKKLPIGKGRQIKEGNKIAILTIGHIGTLLTDLYAMLPRIQTDELAHYDMRFVKPIDENLLHGIFEKFEHIITIEDGTIVGGFGSAVLEFASKNQYQNAVYLKGIPDTFIEHGKKQELFDQIAMNSEALKVLIQTILN
jgi:1-deoxy-D-xylulose-5-phosphate synthase